MMYHHPGHMWIDSSSSPYPHPHPHQMMMMMMMPPSPYQHPWPSYHPLLPHDSCGHTYYPAGGAGYPYTYTYPHCPPPPPHGLYPPFPSAAAAAPPQHHHCCGCNHKDSQLVVDNNKTPTDSLLPLPEAKANNDKQEEPLVVVGDNKTTDSLLPLLLKHHHPPAAAAAAAAAHYPLMWESKANGKTEEKPRAHDPVSLKHPKPPTPGGEMSQDDHGNNRFPFQIFWLPQVTQGLPNEKTNEEGDDSNRHAAAQKVIPLSANEEGDSNRHAAAQKGIPLSANEEGTSTTKHAPVQKVIPVKQVTSTNDENKSPKSIHSDSVDNGISSSSRSSPKTSKLPPVCLRIDPLPRKKKPSSRSPSPPEKQRSSNVNNPKSSQQQQQQSKVLKEEQSQGNIKTDIHANKMEQGEDVPREKVEEKKMMSEHEAALIIQSAYRGFDVRKSQPLKKLRQIYEIRKLVLELRNSIQDLETSSSSSSSTMGLDSKKQVIIGETIMSLLLKLDTIQGLHPFVREVRKSVAKELVALQERLDSLKSQTPSPKQEVMSPQDDDDDATQSRTDLCGNRQHETTEACIVEQQLEKSSEDDDAAKFNEAPTESDTVLGESHQHKATESQGDNDEACDLEQQLEKNTEDDDAKAPTESDTTICESQEQDVGCNIIDEPRLESQKDESHPGCKMVGVVSHKDEGATECDKARGVCENHEVEATESHEEPELGSHKDEAPTEREEAPRLFEDHEVKAQQGTGEESHLAECDDGALLGSCQDHATSEGVGEEESHREKLDPHEVEATESRGEPQLESHKEDNEEAPSDEAVGSTEKVEAAENDIVKPEDNAGERNNDQLEMPGATEESERMKLHDSGNVQISIAKDERAHDDVMEEENEKLRAAVAELMKAGNEQLGVIRELTGRVKDLEKKLANNKNNNNKKKKVKVNKSRRSRACVV